MKYIYRLSYCLPVLFVIGTAAGFFIRRSGGKRPKTFTADLSKPQLTSLYNSDVVKVESYERPMKGVPSIIPHTGVVATTADGGRWLIHKGDDYGKASSTVVTNANNMSNKWTKTGEKSMSGNTVSDLMKAGKVNEEYSTLGTNCWSATKGIMDKGNK